MARERRWSDPFDKPLDWLRAPSLLNGTFQQRVRDNALHLGDAICIIRVIRG
jgi:hypothetical protein